VFGTQQRLLLGGGREDFVVFYKIHTKNNISRERNNRFCYYYTNLIIGGQRFGLTEAGNATFSIERSALIRPMEVVALPASVNRLMEAVALTCPPPLIDLKNKKT